MSKRYKVGVVGATGLVGRELLGLLERDNFPVESLRLYAGIEDAGERVEFLEEEIKVEEMRSDYFKGLDLVFFCAHPMVSRDLAESAVSAGVIVIDGSRQWRLNERALLVVPEINSEVLKRAKAGVRIIASPGPSVVGLSVVLHPIARELGLKRVVVFGLYGSSGAGKKGVEELEKQVVDIFNQQEILVEKFPKQIAFNVFPQVGGFVGASTEEELDIEEELKKVLDLKDLKVSASCSYVPSFTGISMMVYIEVGKKIRVEELRVRLAQAEGVKVIDNPAEEQYPDLLSALSEEKVLVGRVREDGMVKSGYHLWLVIDNLRKGSALNMLEIAKRLIGEGII